ncbi:SEC-C metal-binding domain-containing protein [Planctomycetota bacterium]
MNHYIRERFENWVSDFAASDLARGLPNIPQHAALLVEFLVASSSRYDGEMSEVQQSDLKDSLISVSSKYNIPDSVLKCFPDSCAALLEFLEREGKMADGRSMGLYLKSFRDTLNKTHTHTRPGTKVGRNDPCPCGSGTKYKKCCMNLL